MIVLWWTVDTDATDGSDEVLRVSSFTRIRLRPTLIASLKAMRTLESSLEVESVGAGLRYTTKADTNKQCWYMLHDVSPLKSYSSNHVLAHLAVSMGVSQKPC